MKIKSSMIMISVCTTLLLSTVSLLAQDSGMPYHQISRDSLLNYARTIVDSSRCRVLISADENGKPHAREMSPFAPEKDWIIWMGTTTGSRKTMQIRHNPNVIVYYYDTKGMSYVSGKASLVNDPDKKAKYWVEGWKIFYQDKDKNYILIKVIPESIEVCSFRYKLFWEPVTGIPHQLSLTKNKGDFIQN